MAAKPQERRNMKVWLDDERPIPAGYDIHVKTAGEAIELLKTGNVELISLDHDLGGVATGYDVAKWIAEAAYHNSLPKVKVRIHTMNPIGRENIKSTIRMAYKYWMGDNDGNDESVS